MRQFGGTGTRAYARTQARGAATLDALWRIMSQTPHLARLPQTSKPRTTQTTT